MTDAYDKVLYRGRLMDEMTKAFVIELEKELGYDLSIMQGSYNTTVAASAGTHDGGGVIDLTAYDWKRKCEAIGDLGGFGWYRRYLPGVWGAHVHFGIRDHKKLASVAARQQTDWDARPPRNGLASHAPMDLKTDPHPLKVIKFKYPVTEAPVPSSSPGIVSTPRTKAASELVEAIHHLGNAAAYLDGDRKKSAKDAAVCEKIKQRRVELKANLNSLRNP